MGKNIAIVGARMKVSGGRWLVRATSGRWHPLKKGINKMDLVKIIDAWIDQNIEKN